MDAFLNIAFSVLHTAWIAFVCVGWIWRRTRPWQLGAATLTALSWFGLGIWYGWGYCPCTDWHWQVRERLGYDDPPSYVQVLIQQVTGVEVAGGQADGLTVSVFLIATALGVGLTIRDRRGGRARRT